MSCLLPGGQVLRVLMIGTRNKLLLNAGCADCTLLLLSAVAEVLPISRCKKLVCSLLTLKLMAACCCLQPLRCCSMTDAMPRWTFTPLA